VYKGKEGIEKREKEVKKERFARIMLKSARKRMFFVNGFTAAGYAQSNKWLPLAK
jgi:hypothetical protein